MRDRNSHTLRYFSISMALRKVYGWKLCKFSGRSDWQGIYYIYCRIGGNLFDLELKLKPLKNMQRIAQVALLSNISHWLRFLVFLSTECWWFNHCLSQSLVLPETYVHTLKGQPMKKQIYTDIMHKLSPRESFLGIHTNARIKEKYILCNLFWIQ